MQTISVPEALERSPRGHDVVRVRARALCIAWIGLLAWWVAAACQGDARDQVATGRSSTEAPGQVPGVPRGHLVMANDTDDGQWTMAAKDFANTRYTALDQIRPDNAGELAVAWTYDTGLTNGHEAAPLVIGETMYVVTPYPNRLVALDLSHRGVVRWEYAPPHDDAARGVACCDTVNRGAAFADGKLYFATLDDHLIAVDAATGRGVFDTKLGDINQGETITMAPIVVRGKGPTAIAARTASSTSRCSPASAAGPARSSRSAWIRAICPRASGGATPCRICRRARRRAGGSTCSPCRNPPRARTGHRALVSSFMGRSMGQL
jgi:hypothetical protein